MCFPVSAGKHISVAHVRPNCTRKSCRRMQYDRILLMLRRLQFPLCTELICMIKLQTCLSSWLFPHLIFVDERRKKKTQHEFYNIVLFARVVHSIPTGCRRAEEHRIKITTFVTINLILPRVCAHSPSAHSLTRSLTQSDTAKQIDI